MMFRLFRAGSFAAAAALLSATVVAADPSLALGSSAPAPVSAINPHEAIDSQPVALAAEQDVPQVVVPVQRETSFGSDHSDITIDGVEPAAPIDPSPALPALAAPAPVNAVRAPLAQLVAEHRSTEVPNRERECLAGAIYFESKGEPLSGQVAVGQVIVNRATSGRFPKSWCGVVFQRSQFSFVRSGGLPPIPRGSAHWKTAVAVAHIVANDLTDAVVPRALFFHARYVSPGWKLNRIATVGNHIFYR